MKTTTVILYEKTAAGVDPFNKTVWEETPTDVKDVLYAPSSAQEILDGINLYGKKAVYTLAIPKGDTHEWEDCRVNIKGQAYRVFGIPLEGMDENIPLAWNKKVTVERYE